MSAHVWRVHLEPREAHPTMSAHSSFSLDPTLASDVSSL